MVECGRKSHSLRKEAALECGSTAVDTSVSLASRVNRLLLRWVLFFQYPLGSMQASHLTNITDARQISTNEVQCGFNHPLQSPPVPGRAHLMPFSVNISMFYTYSSGVYGNPNNDQVKSIKGLTDTLDFFHSKVRQLKFGPISELWGVHSVVNNLTKLLRHQEQCCCTVHGF